tara:strand:- start:33 stop:1427 length:1395 start_codon:yes stop_codon:yes gene_type:complete
MKGTSYNLDFDFLSGFEDKFSPDRRKVMNRREYGEFIKRRLARMKARYDDFQIIQGEVHDIKEKGHFNIVSLADGTEIKARHTVIATGNSELKRLPCLSDEVLSDPDIAERVTVNQWDVNEKSKLKNIPRYGSVLIVGTGLSGDDAFRSLLHSGFRGNVIMASRNGYRHFPYRNKHKDLKPYRNSVPAFMWQIRAGNYSPKEVLQSALNEFEQLTGIHVNSETGQLRRRTLWERASQTIRPVPYSSEEVLNDWQRYVPEIAEFLGPKEFGKVISHYGALLNTLRVGAGYDVSREIRNAQKLGARPFLSIKAANLMDVRLSSAGQKLNVTYKDTETGEEQVWQVDHIISSLGPNYDFSHSNHSLWQNLYRRGYASTHATGVGLDVNKNGLLAGAKTITAIGPVTAGQRMLDDGIIGPPAYSVPGMSSSIDRAREAVAQKIRKSVSRNQGAAPKLSPELERLKYAW